MSRSFSFLLLLFIAAFVVASGCSDDSPQCSINSDCDNNQVCQQGSCVTECREQRDCPSGHACNAGRCEPIYAGNCATDRDCRNGEACVSGVCQLVDTTGEDQAAPDTLAPDAGDDTDQGADTAEPDTLEPEDTAIPDTTQPDTTQPDTTQPDTTQPDTTPSDLVDSEDVSCPPLSGGYGDPCACAAQCTTGLCIGDVTTGQGTCTSYCSNRSQCAGGADSCLEVAVGQRVCAPDDSGQSCDQGGVADPTMCTYRTCLGAAGEGYSPAAFCSIPCTSASECRAGYACSPVVCRDISGTEGYLQCIPTLVPYEQVGQREQLLSDYPMPGRFCMPAGEYNACASDADGADCASAICLTPESLCSAQCLDPVDCPAGTCIEYDTNDNRIPIGYCSM